MNRDTTNRFVLLLLAFFISATFLSMIRSFLLAIFLAGIFSALARKLVAASRKAWFLAALVARAQCVAAARAARPSVCMVAPTESGADVLRNAEAAMLMSSCSIPSRLDG